MKKVVIANFKSNLSKDDIINYIEQIKANNFSNLDLVFCPSAVYLNYFIEGGLKTGSQDVSVFKSGSYTGEVNALQLKDLGVDYSIVGHSERRKYFDEENYLASKITNLIVANITPVLCIGETLNDREKGLTKSIIEKQLDDSFIEINNIDINKIIIAYEPVWAIGTNIIPTNEEIEEMVIHIQNYIRLKYDASVKIIYGGSVNQENILDLKLLPNLNGYLIGGSSLHVDEYIELLKKLDFDSSNII